MTTHVYDRQYIDGTWSASHPLQVPAIPITSTNGVPAAVPCTS